MHFYTKSVVKKCASCYLPAHMKNISFVLTLVLLVQSQAQAFDTFFKGDGRFFVKTDSLVENGVGKVLFSDCEVLAANKSQAVCHQIAKVNKDQFDHMQACTPTSALIDKGIGVVSGAAGLGMLGYATIGIGFISGFSGIVIIGGGIGAVMMFSKGSDDKAMGTVVYSDNNKNSVNFIAPSKIKFEDFNRMVQDSLDSTFGCDVSKGLTKVDGTQYLHQLSAEQIDWLRQAQQ